MSTPEPRALIAMLQQGDPGAQSRFWREHHGWVLAICRHILGSSAEAQDMACDVMTEFMFRCVHRLQNPGAAEAYLRLMATRRSLRLKQRRKEYPSEDLDREIGSQDGGAQRRAEQAWAQPRLELCLAELSPKAQDAVRLRFAEEMTNERIGGLIGGSKQYIGRLLTKSLALLRECLQRGRED